MRNFKAFLEVEVLLTIHFIFVTKKKRQKNVKNGPLGSQHEFVKISWTGLLRSEGSPISEMLGEFHELFQSFNGANDIKGPKEL